MPLSFGSMIDSVKTLFARPEQPKPYEVMNVNDIEVPKRLMSAIRRNYEDMRQYREYHHQAVNQFLSRYIKDMPANERVIVNEIRRMVKIYMRLLVGGVPQCDVSTSYPELEYFSENFQRVFNRHLKEIDLGEPVYRAVWNAMFSVGIMKTGLAEGSPDGTVEIDGESFDIGKPFSQSISLDHFVIDMQARSPEAITFIGDRFLRPTDWIAQRSRARQDAQPGSELVTNSQMSAPDRISGLSEETDKRIYRQSYCWDIYLPQQGIMCLFADGDDTPLEAYKCEHPEGGPYRMLGFDWVDGEVLPAAPVQALYGLHMLINNIYRKLENQGRRSKHLHVYQRSNETDGKTVQNAEDGDVVGLTNVDSIKPLNLDGPDATLQIFSQTTQSIFDNYAGGLQVLAGTAPMSETLGQDQLLHRSANAQIDEMRRQISKFMKAIIGQHAWFVWSDPIRSYDATAEVGSTGVTYRVEVSPEMREGDFLQYNFNMRPYSLVESSPSEEAAMLERYWNGNVMPSIQMLMQEGKMPSTYAYLERLAKLMNLDIEKLFIETEPAPVQPAGGDNGMIPWPKQMAGQGQPQRPPRMSMPGHTEAGNRNETLKALTGMLSSNANPQKRVG